MMAMMLTMVVVMVVVKKKKKMMMVLVVVVVERRGESDLGPTPTLRRFARPLQLRPRMRMVGFRLPMRTVARRHGGTRGG